MAYDASKEVRTEVAEIKKNDRGEVIRVSVIKNESGTEFVDARLFYTDDNGEKKPTSKGFRVNAEMAEDLAEAFKKVADEEY